MRLPHASRFGVLAAPALLLAASCSEPSERSPNVLLIVIDTLRWDHVGCYGAERATTPNIDALAARSTVFERAYTTAPWTLPAVASMLTGRFAGSHGLVRVDSAVPGEVRTLAEDFADRGYVTAGFTGNALVREENGLTQGFQVFDDSEARGHDHVSSEGIAAGIVERLRSWAQSERPFFLFALFFDPHYQYRRHAGIGFAPASAGRLRGEETIRQLRRLDPPLTGAELAFVRDLYDEEIRFTDAAIGDVLSALEELGMADDTIVVITADHGEQFLEHGWLGHVRDLYEELVRVPLVIHLPEGPAARRVESPVSLVGLAPTLRELAGLPGATAPGAESLVPRLRGTDAARGGAPIYFDVDFVARLEANSGKNATKKGILFEGYKLVRDDEVGTRELYFLDDDPLEKNDLAAAVPARVERMAAMLEQAIARASIGAVDPSTLDLDADDLRLLDDLGYGGGD